MSPSNKTICVIKEVPVDRGFGFAACDHTGGDVYIRKDQITAIGLPFERNTCFQATIKSKTIAGRTKYDATGVESVPNEATDPMCIELKKRIERDSERKREIPPAKTQSAARSAEKTASCPTISLFDERGDVLQSAFEGAEKVAECVCRKTSTGKIRQYYDTFADLVSAIEQEITPAKRQVVWDRVRIYLHLAAARAHYDLERQNKPITQDFAIFVENMVNEAVQAEKKWGSLNPGSHFIDVKRYFEAIVGFGYKVANAND